MLRGARPQPPPGRDRQEARGRALLAALTGVGLAGLTGDAVMVVAAGSAAIATDLPSLLLPATFLLAGVIGGLARPDHRGLLLLTAVGSLHLAAFALMDGVGLALRLPPLLAWAMALLGDAAYLAGFAALAVLAAAYPAGTPRSLGQRRFAGVVVATWALVVLDEALLHAALPLGGQLGRRSVPTPAAVVLVPTSVHLAAAVPALVVVGVLVRVATARSMPEAERRALGWGVLAFGLLAFMLIASPAAAVLLPQRAWDLAFPLVVAVAPFLLLAGLVHHRLLEVDLYVVRTLARGGVVVVVVAAWALASVVLDTSSTAIAGLLLTVLAAFTGVPLARRLERLVDRFVTGGRVGHDALLDELATGLAAMDADALPDRICAGVARGLDVAWVRLASSEQVGVDDAGGAPEVSVELATRGRVLGALECGPRRGGWRSGDRALVQRLAGPIALALSDVELTRELALRVAELSASRSRLVSAEDTARRRIERDLHDGVQQQLIALLARLSVARAQVVASSPVEATLRIAHDLARDAVRDLRQLVSGLHPPLLGDRGVAAAVEARALLLPIAVAVDADPRLAETRFPPEVEGAAYFVVCEALANVMKHSGAGRARVVLAATTEHGQPGLQVAVVDEGNGSVTSGGTGLLGLRDRVEALGGAFAVQACQGVGTTVVAQFPVEVPSASVTVSGSTGG